MKALLKFFKIDTLVLFVVNYWRGITPQQWNTALDLVATAELEIDTGDERKKWVFDRLRTAFTVLAAGAINLLIESALSHMEKKA